MTHWYEAFAGRLGSAYLRYSFTKGTDQEVAFLTEVLELQPGATVLDVGCGPGRHAHALAGLGVEVVGVDISQRFVDLANEHAPDGATFVRADARELHYESEFDAVISMCQGAFGLQAGPFSGDPDADLVVLEGMSRALKPGGRLALTAFSAYFEVHNLEGDDFDASSGVAHEQTEIRDESGHTQPAEAWTTCFTPRELRLMARQAGLVPEHVWSVTPGAFGPHPPTIDSPEFLLVARKPA